MACSACEKWQDENQGEFWYRWKAANIAIVACREHAKEIIEALNDRQQADRKEK